MLDVEEAARLSLDVDYVEMSSTSAARYDSCGGTLHGWSSPRILAMEAHAPCPHIHYPLISTWRTLRLQHSAGQHLFETLQREDTVWIYCGPSFVVFTNMYTQDMTLHSPRRSGHNAIT